MYLSEYQAKEILARYGVPVPEGGLARTPEEAEARARALSSEKVVVKAQILAGGRGLAGGVKFAATPSGVRDEAEAMLGQRLVTEQTGPAGEVVERVYVEAAVDDRRSLYLALVIDERTGEPTLLAASEGGVAFEAKARSDPDMLHALGLAADGGVDDGVLSGFLAELGLEGQAADDVRRLAQGMVRAAFETDALLVEINPLVIGPDGRAVAVDAKMVIDDNALYRHPEFERMARDAHRDEYERVARENDINFVKMQGDIGVVVNGAGLGLATNDMLADAGGRPANFMDIRTTATSIQIARGIDVLLGDPNGQGAAGQRPRRRHDGLRHRRRGDQLRLRPGAAEAADRVPGGRAERGLGGQHHEGPAAAVRALRRHDAGGRARGRDRRGGALMAVLVGEETRVLVQGLTGRAGTFYTDLAMRYGSTYVGGVRPGKGGRSHIGLPVFDNAREAVAATGANASLVMVPPHSAAAAIIEAVEAEIPLVVCVTERLPVLDMLRVKAALKGARTDLVGPNSQGVLAPGICKIGVMSTADARPGPIGIVSRSASLTSEVVAQCSAARLGQSTTIGIGGDPIHGLGFARALELFRDDPATEGVIVIGEIGGVEEESAADLLAGGYGKPVVALVAGRHAPRERRMGHAGTLAMFGAGSAEAKMKRLAAAGAIVVEDADAVAGAMKAALARHLRNPCPR